MRTGTVAPREVSVLLEEHGSRRKQGDAEGDTDTLGKQRIDLLAPVLSLCRDLWSTESEELDLVAEKLADGSRDVAWRLPYGEAGILEFFVALLAEGHLRRRLHVHALRLIGNSCADTNENRARVVDKDRFLSVTRQVADESLIPFHIPVIYNILVDYEPAQSLASKSHLSKQLISLLSLPHINEYALFVPYMCKILALLAAQDGEAAAADPATVRVLLNLAQQTEDVQDFVSLVAVAAAYLASETLQSRLISDNQVPLLMDTFHRAHMGFDINAIDDDEDVAAQMKRLRSSLLSILADVSGNDSFGPACPLSDDVPHTLLDWLRATNNLSLQSAACLSLGNISRSDAASVALVNDYGAHEPLVKLLSDPAVTDPQLLHAACSFLKNLAIPASNKLQLRDVLLPGCVPRLYSLDTLPQVQFAAVSLTRVLLLNCPANVRQICAPFSRSCPVSPSPPSSSSSSSSSRPAAKADDDNEQTIARDIIALHARSDAGPTRLEAARCVAAICRALHSAPPSTLLPEATSPPCDTESSSPSPSDDERRRRAFYAAHDVQKPLRFLITQGKWPSLRSEAWFVLALMSRSGEGASVVLSLLDDDAAEAALRKTIAGQNPDGSQQDVALDHLTAADSPACELALEPTHVDAGQKASMARVDAENALVLCTELVKLGEGPSRPGREAVLRGLVRQGTRRLVGDGKEGE